MTGATLTGGWRKSSYSGDNGGACIECATWRKSTHSGDNGGDCIECAATRHAVPRTAVLVRDTKSPATPALSFTPQAWQAFTQSLR